MPATNDKLLVVGAGLPRTGTMTMKAALQRLLGEKCYHMDEFVKNGCEADAEHWRRALRGEATDKDWRDFFGGKDYRACVDYPASFFYKVREHVSLGQLFNRPQSLISRISRRLFRTPRLSSR